MSKSMLRTAQARSLTTPPPLGVPDDGSALSAPVPEAAYRGTAVKRVSDQVSAQLPGARPVVQPHVVRSEAPPPDRTADPAYTCDLCRKVLEESQLQCTDGDAQLCEYCFKQFNALPQGKIRQCLERFMLGNVV